jgi:hypothetical protein
VEGNQLHADATSLENASRLSKQWLEVNQSSRPIDPNYQHTPRTFSHSPRPMLKSVMREIEREAPELFEGVRSTVFRTWNKPTIISDFVLRWSLAHGLAKIIDHSHVYIATDKTLDSPSLKHLQKLFGKIDFFCINDTTDDAQDGDPRLVQVRKVLNTLLPHVSQNESLYSPVETSLQASVSV